MQLALHSYLPLQLNLRSRESEFEDEQSSNQATTCVAINRTIFDTVVGTIPICLCFDLMDYR